MEILCKFKINLKISKDYDLKKEQKHATLYWNNLKAKIKDNTLLAKALQRAKQLVKVWQEAYKYCYHLLGCSFEINNKK